MINSKYAKAYTEVLEVIKHFPKEEYSKIPQEKIEFYKNNMDTNYKFTIDPEINLSKQNISKEANAIIITIYIDYFATEEQKIKIKEILELNQKKAELAKKEKYNPVDLFNNKNKNNIPKYEQAEIDLVEHKETFFAKFKNYIFKLLHIKN